MDKYKTVQELTCLWKQFNFVFFLLTLAIQTNLSQKKQFLKNLLSMVVEFFLNSSLKHASIYPLCKIHISKCKSRVYKVNTNFYSFVTVYTASLYKIKFELKNVNPIFLLNLLLYTRDHAVHPNRQFQLFCSQKKKEKILLKQAMRNFEEARLNSNFSLRGQKKLRGIPNN